LTPDRPSRQPVHTLYGGANLFTPGICRKLGRIALRALEDHGPFPGISEDVAARVKLKLETEPIEDYRIDFEDGYGDRSTDDEDLHAESSAIALADCMRDSLLPPFIGIRIKPLDDEHRPRAVRTLELFLSTLLDRTGGELPPNFVVTLPKLTGPHNTAALADLFDLLEIQHALPAGTLKFEFLVETPPAVASLTAILDAARGRATGAHLGAYDYMASIGIPATAQNLLHPACDFVRNHMQMAYSARGVFLADGATNLMPIGSRDDVHRGWQMHFRDVRNSLSNGFYQGWDLHPAQLVSRYAAVHSFFRADFTSVAARLRNFQEKFARATLTGTVFDDAATIRGLVAYLDRAIDCAAISKSEIPTLV
jgi:citrate lyase beta subunit